MTQDSNTNNGISPILWLGVVLILCTLFLAVFRAG